MTQTVQPFYPIDIVNQHIVSTLQIRLSFYMDELNGVSAGFQSHPDAAEIGCWDCYAGGQLVPLGEEKIQITSMSGMQPSRTSTKTKNSFFSRDKKKKGVKNTTSCPGFLVFFFSLQGRRLISTDAFLVTHINAR